MNQTATAAAPPPANTAYSTAFGILFAISFSHLLNDMMQSLMPSLYPLFQANYKLSFGQIGFLTLTYQTTASLLQPLIGAFTDRQPKPYSLAIGMGFTLVGLLLLARADSFPLLLLASSLVGTGSSVFHPESSRVARMASGGRHGLAQSVFQVGGNLGAAIGPLLAAFIVMPQGQKGIAWFSAAALLGMIILTRVGHWYRGHGTARIKPRGAQHALGPGPWDPAMRGVMAVILGLIFSKYFYLASFSSYYIFYLKDHFHISTRTAQVYLFVFLGSVALGTILGGPIGDRIGRKPVIWLSILGVLPFSLLLPHASLLWTVVLTMPIGFILASAFPAIVVYAQELMPGRPGTVAGLLFGLSFGMGGVGAAVLGHLADATSIEFVYRVCAYLPLLGLLAALLPDVKHPHGIQT